MEAAYAEYTKSSGPTQDQPMVKAPSSSISTTPPVVNGAVQEGSGLEGTERQGDAVIDITPVDPEKAGDGEDDDSAVAVSNEQPEIP